MSFDAFRAEQPGHLRATEAFLLCRKGYNLFVIQLYSFEDAYG